MMNNERVNQAFLSLYFKGMAEILDESSNRPMVAGARQGWKIKSGGIASQE